MRAAAVAVVLVLAAVAAVFLLLLVVARVLRDISADRRERRAVSLRRLVFEAVLADDPAAAEALQQVGGGRAGRVLEAHAFRLLAKVSGDVRYALVSLLVMRGADQRAAAMLTSSWAVRRGRGAHRLGLLGNREAGGALRALLHDRDPLVRRVAVRSLGQVGDDGAVLALVAVTVRDRALVRDAHAAVAAIGSAAAPPLIGALRSWLDRRHGQAAAAFAARALGDLGSIEAVPVLVRAADASDDVAASPENDVVTGAVRSLGRIGSREGVEALLGVLASDDPTRRAAAAVALGEIGDARAADALGAAIDGRDERVDRGAAGALLCLGEAGRAVLEAHPSPYAAEALAVALIRAAA